LVTFDAGIEVKNGTTGSGFVRIYEDADYGINYVELRTPALAANYILYLPNEAPTVSGALLSCDVTTNLCGWTDPSTVVGTVDTAGDNTWTGTNEFEDTVTLSGALIFGSGTGILYNTAGTVTTEGTIPATAITGGTASTVACWDAGTALTSCGAVNGSGVPVLTTSATLVTPLLGTPTSGTLTNCTGLPVAGITASTSTALGVGSIELGHASDTSITRIAAGVAAIEGNIIGGAQTPVIGDADTFAAGCTGACLYGGTFIVSVAGTAALPNATVGMNFTIVLEDAVATVIEPYATGTDDTIVLNGTALTQGHNITSSTKGAMCVFQYRAADSWMATCNGFVDGT
jgi:hypothetical protein